MYLFSKYEHELKQKQGDDFDLEKYMKHFNQLQNKPPIEINEALQNYLKALSIRIA
jgi:hypothetical protein